MRRGEGGEAIDAERAESGRDEGGELDEMVGARYADAHGGTALGKRLKAGDVSLEELADYAMAHGEPQGRSGRQEAFESIFNSYAYE